MSLQDQAYLAAAADAAVAALCILFVGVARGFHDEPTRRRTCGGAVAAAVIAVGDAALRLGTGSPQTWYLPVYGLMIALIGWVSVLHGVVVLRRLLELRARNEASALLEADNKRRRLELHRRFGIER